jgi:hypothetical protein
MAALAFPSPSLADDVVLLRPWRESDVPAQLSHRGRSQRRGPAERGARKGRDPGVRRRVIGSGIAPASVEKRRRSPCSHPVVPRCGRRAGRRRVHDRRSSPRGPGRLHARLGSNFATSRVSDETTPGSSAHMRAARPRVSWRVEQPNKPTPRPDRGSRSSGGFTAKCLLNGTFSMGAVGFEPATSRV